MSLNNFSFGQFNRTKNWVLGDSILIDFNTAIPSVGSSAIVSLEGISCISDTNGNLLFYTNGIKVWDANHQLMPNGLDLNGHVSATNGALIVPLPNDPNVYYIFVVGSKNGYDGIFNGLSYSIVDLSLNGGFGDVTIKNQVLYLKSTEKLCGTKHSNGIDFWIVSHEAETDRFFTYQLTENGIDTIPKISTVGQVHYEEPLNFTGVGAIGSMRFSFGGCKLALIHRAYFHVEDKLEIFDFDNSSGYVFNPIDLKPEIGSDMPYALCFSPSNSKIYVSIESKIIQFDLSSNNESIIQSSKTIIASASGGQSGTSDSQFMDIQVAPDGKIYIARLNKSMLSSINSPNSVGAATNYIDTAIYFEGKYCHYGLPNFVQNFILSDSLSFENCQKYCPELILPEDTVICEGDSVSIELSLPIGNYLWSTSDSCPNITINTSGSYSLIYNFNDCPTQFDTIQLDITPIVEFNLPDSSLCTKEPYKIEIPFFENVVYEWSNGISGNTFTTNDDGVFYLSVNNSGCMSLDTFSVIIVCDPIIEMPNVFSPNSDGVNDFFEPIRMENIEILEFSIINRWGNNVFTGVSQNYKWNGKYRDEQCTDGVYFFHMKYVDIEMKEYTLTNFFTLIK